MRLRAVEERVFAERAGFLVGAGVQREEGVVAAGEDGAGVGTAHADDGDGVGVDCGRVSGGVGLGGVEERAGKVTDCS